jgi:hydroxymethylglutaryl-CoA lyase
MSNDIVRIVEVGPRDGLQNEKTIISLEDKLKFISMLSDAGHTDIEVTSFVKPASIPQMQDASELFPKVKELLKNKNISLPCLVPNLQGYEKAKALGVDEIAIFVATSEAFSKKNINASIDEAFERLNEFVPQALRDGKKVRGYLSTAFGCPYEGVIPLAKTIELTKRLLKLGVYEVSLGDTTGVAHPRQVKELLADLKRDVPFEKLALHFHDTRGMALTNIYVGVEAGIRTLDSSSGGIGGCPYAKGATGNVATEDVCYLLKSLGLKTSIDFNKLSEASKFILEKLGKETSSKSLKAYLNTGKI